MKKLIKVLVGTVITLGIVANYVFPTTFTSNDYCYYIEFFNGEGIVIEK